MAKGFSGWFEKKCLNCKKLTTVEIKEVFDEWAVFYSHVKQVVGTGFWGHCNHCLHCVAFEVVGMSPDPEWLAQRRAEAEAKCKERRRVLGVRDDDDKKGEETCQTDQKKK